MNEGPDFSIIIPSYNRASFLMKAIQSVLNQTHTNFELIVVDDGSTDNTRELIENSTDPRLKYIFQQNAERAAARNKGAQLAIGKYITFFDSDDLLFSNHLAEAQKFVDLHQGIECFHQGYQIRNTVTGKVKKVTNKKETCNAKLIEGNGLSCNGVFLRNDIAKSNLFNENRNLSGLEDWELWLRIAVSFPIYSNPVITSEIIDHNDRSVVNADKIKLIKKNGLIYGFGFKQCGDSKLL